MKENNIGKTCKRPWGSYKILDLGDGFQIKILKINPDGKLSLQKHLKRCEHWVVVKGQAQITVGEDKKTYSIDEGVYVPKNTLHRIENLTKEVIVIVEVQTGSYLGEDDLIRVDDIYGRD